MRNTNNKYRITLGKEIYTIKELSQLIGVSNERLRRFANSKHKNHPQYKDLWDYKDSFIVLPPSKDERD